MPKSYKKVDVTRERPIELCEIVKKYHIGFIPQSSGCNSQSRYRIPMINTFKETAKFIIRLTQNLLKFFLVSLPLTLVGAILLAVYLPIHREFYRDNLVNSMRLPSLLRWFDNADIYPEFKRDFTTYAKVFAGPLFTHYTWLAFRNPINYFSYKYMAMSWTGREQWIRYDIFEEDVGDAYMDRPGLRYIEIEQDGKVFYEYYYIKRWSATKCFRFRMGWKVQDKRNGIGSKVQDVLVLSPYKSYAGI